VSVLSLGPEGNGALWTHIRAQSSGSTPKRGTPVEG
jgi:hypothetical protein